MSLVHQVYKSQTAWLPYRSALLTACVIAALVCSLVSACQPSPREVGLRVGEYCDGNNQCTSGYCEDAADPGPKICCSVPCPDDTRCDDSGGFCKAVCGSEGCGNADTELGSTCVWDHQCISGYCRADALGSLRCCEYDCDDFGEICARDGICELADEEDLPPDSRRDGLTAASGSSEAGEASGALPGASSSSGSSNSVSAASGSLLQCGNGELDAGEECDGELACSRECQLIECGNNRLDAGEECDPPEAGSCSPSCREIACGNRRIDEGEECEPPGAASCGSNCVLIRCGNNRVDEGEECDPPSAGSCDVECQAIACGNGRVDEGEGCDPPSSGTCSAECRPLDCGNGVVDPGEDCDPPMSGSCDGNCQDIECGNGSVDTGEDCEPPGTAECNDVCQDIVCGDSRVDEGEECDPPVSGECSAECLTIECGNGRIDPGETCEPTQTDDPECSDLCNTRDVSTGADNRYTFDSDSEGWVVRLTSPESLEASTTLEFKSDAGEPTAGCLELLGAYTGENQKVEINVHESPVLNVAGRILSGRIRLLSGFAGGGIPGGVKMFAKAGPDYAYISGDWVDLTPGEQWLTVRLDPANPDLQTADFDAQDVRELGFEIRTFVGSTNVEPAVVQIDSVALSD